MTVATTPAPPRKRCLCYRCQQREAQGRCFGMCRRCYHEIEGHVARRPEAVPRKESRR